MLSLNFKIFKMNFVVAFLFCATLMPALAGATLNYNFQDVMAQSTCTAVVPNTYSRVWAMRRECSHVGRYTCNQICSNKGMTCFEALHVYKGPPILRPNPQTAQPDEGVPGLSMFRYFGQGCNWRAGHCGPNYCCCRGPWRLQPTNIVL